ncbi:hypothetical protein T11_10632, partial [Trichinella zimbabwensis]
LQQTSHFLMSASVRHFCVINARFNITDVICAPSFTCFTAADNFIKGFQDGLEDEMKILNIKVDGGLSSTVEGYYLHKQFRSMVVESGFNVDETYDDLHKVKESSAEKKWKDFR